MKKLVFSSFIAVFITHAVNAGQPSAAITLSDDLRLSVSRCELLVSELEQLAGMYGVPPQERMNEQTKCLIDGHEKMRSAFEAYKASSPTKSELDAAKDLYAAYIAYADAISSARSRRDLRRSIEAADLNKARATFQVETGI